MKKAYIFMMIALLAAFSCTREETQDSPAGGELVIRLALDDLLTKGTAAGTADENAVNSLDVIIFSEDGTTQYYNTHVASPSLEAGGYYEQTTTVSALTGLTGTTSQKSDALKVAKVFAVANYSGGSISPTATLDNVKALTVDASAVLSSQDVLDGDLVKKKVADHPVFVMTAESGFTQSGSAILASLRLKRLMSKITLTVNYKNPIVTSGTDIGLGETTKITWEPITSGENMRVYVENAASNGRLDGAKPASYTPIVYADTHPTEETAGNWVSPAFYTYPVEWTKGADSEPFIKLVQPWKYITSVERDGTDIKIDENVVELYYKIMLPGDVTKLASNTWYRPTVTLDVLGGEAGRETELVSTSLFILDWGSTAGSLSNVEITTPKYLVPEARTLTVNNGNPLKVKFFASGDVEMTIVRIHKKVYGNAAMIEREIYPTRDAKVKDIHNSSWVTVTQINADGIAGTDDDTYGYIYLNHTLSANFAADNFSARPYDYEIKLHLTGEDTSLDKTVHIIQNPPMMVTAQMSNGYVNVNGTTSTFNNIYRKRTSSTDKPITYGEANAAHAILANPTYKISSVTSGQKYLGRVATYRYLDSSDGANNACQYRIIINAYPEEGTYIQDSRKKYKSSDFEDKVLNRQYKGSGKTETPAAIEGLANYLPSDNTHFSDGKEGYAAPVIMFASSYGANLQLSNMQWGNALLRCATYQEDGYPAGRWRLPTEREAYLAYQLYNKGAIPNLFADPSESSTVNYYLTSSGYGIATDETGSLVSRGKNTNHVRCVYDLWYWGDKEVDTCKDGTYTDATGTYPRYKWGGIQTD